MTVAVQAIASWWCHTFKNHCSESEGCVSESVWVNIFGQELKYRRQLRLRGGPDNHHVSYRNPSDHLFLNDNSVHEHLFLNKKQRSQIKLMGKSGQTR